MIYVSFERCRLSEFFICKQSKFKGLISIFGSNEPSVVLVFNLKELPIGVAIVSRRNKECPFEVCQVLYYETHPTD